MVRTGITIAAIYLVSILVQTSWFGLCALNIIGCVIVTMRPAGRMQSAIGGMFLAAVLCNGACGIATILGRKINLAVYHNSLNDIQFLQVALFATWGMGRGIWLARRPYGYSQIASISHHAGME